VHDLPHVVATTDVDEARVEVGKLFCPHRLSPARGADLRLHLRAQTLGDVGLVHLDYGAPVRIDPGRLGSFHLVQRPLGGRATITQGKDEIVSSPSLASVLSPHLPVSMSWGQDNPQSIIYLSRRAVQDHLGRLLGRPVTGPVHFALGMSSASAAVQAWLRAVAFVQDELDRGNPFFDTPGQRTQIEGMLVGQLLAAQPHNHSPALEIGGAAVSRVVRAAVELIDGHHAEALTVPDIAEAVGVSVRSLQEGFRRDLDTSPTAYLRGRRLAAARAALQAADPRERTVSGIASSHGFLHLGRFSVDYRRAFGESPSTTLAR
jgi:AraC-like DNA-binding protein